MAVYVQEFVVKENVIYLPFTPNIVRQFTENLT